MLSHPDIKKTRRQDLNHPDVKGSFRQFNDKFVSLLTNETKNNVILLCAADDY